MKWENKRLIKKLKAKEQERLNREKGYRIIIKFLWFPKTLGTTTKWLCHIKCKQVMRRRMRWWALQFDDVWVDDVWVDDVWADEKNEDEMGK